MLLLPASEFGDEEEKRRLFQQVPSRPKNVVSSECLKVVVRALPGLASESQNTRCRGKSAFPPRKVASSSFLAGCHCRGVMTCRVVICRLHVACSMPCTALCRVACARRADTALRRGGGAPYLPSVRFSGTPETSHFGDPKPSFGKADHFSSPFPPWKT